MIATCAGVNTLGSTARLVLSSIDVAWISSRSWRVSTRSGIGVSQMSASRPTWWLAWPVSIGPPRGCEMSPTSRPVQPSCSRFRGEALQQLDELGVAPGAIARQAHRLPVGAGIGEVHAAGKAALGVPAEGARRERGRGRHLAEQIARQNLRLLSFPSCRRLFSRRPSWRRRRSGLLLRRRSGRQTAAARPCASPRPAQEP